MVYVVMSTYNGEQYIGEQLDSILSQTYSDIKLLIRDDGSTDSTIDVLEQYKKVYPNIDYYVGDNIGVVRSFYDVLGRIPKDVDYIACCDQDDVWFPDKIETAVNVLESMGNNAPNKKLQSPQNIQSSGVVNDIKTAEIPMLYCGLPQLVDNDLKPLNDTLEVLSPRISFGNAMIENICVGCTMVFNRALYELVRDKWPRQSLMHDWWIYQVAVCFGRVFYDDTPHIYYRQHVDNQVGKVSDRISLIKKQVRSLKRFRGKYTAQMKEFIETFTLEGENRYLAEIMTGTRDSIACRWRVLFDKRIYRQGKWDTLFFKGMLFLGIL